MPLTHFHILTTVFFLLTLGQPIKTSPVPLFYRLANNVTVVCPYADIGAKGVIDGKVFLKIDRSYLNDFITNKLYYSMPQLCTTGITDMSYLFYNSPINTDIGNWDVSTVENMEYMFFKAVNFDQPLMYWDIRRVIHRNGIFHCAFSFYNFINQKQNTPTWHMQNIDIGCNRDHLEFMKNVMADDREMDSYNDGEENFPNFPNTEPSTAPPPIDFEKEWPDDDDHDDHDHDDDDDDGVTKSLLDNFLPLPSIKDDDIKND